ncbi:apolipoprotein N-acyltransferase [Pseudorhodobacter sp. E13]|uniref:apolipoprotein N-acyltransferase n=1 Tax=Pseudorhodobacter sp. E13 TaxID=2487931 RepID=UPI000F8E531A|nr:apolipoprotein N-acyltransferase [Pseudorhodobacter sp. E13]RUS60250.1 apolipoprotein N-acyltransferase [Pseudorhodobacter sp. E13]
MRQRLLGAWPGWTAAGAAFGLGAVMALGQAPLGLWWLTLPAFAAALHLIAQAQSWGRAAWLGWFLGGGYFLVSLSWIVEPFLIDAETYAWMIPFVLVLMPFGMGLFWALAAGLGHRLPQRLAALAVMFAAAELLRSYLFTGFPWALIGHIWVDTPVAQLAAFAGPIGLTLLTAAIAAAIASARVGPVAAAALALGGAYIFGAATLNTPIPPRAAPAIVRLVQPNAEQHLKWEADRAHFYFQRQLDLTAARKDGPPPDLVVWPETSVPYLLNDNEGVLAAIARAGQGAQVAVGIQRVEGNRGFNSLAVISAEGRATHIYDKFHLVPFGEYIPFGDLAFDLFGISAFAAQQGAGYSAGSGAALLPLGTRLGTALPLICYEAVFPQDLRAAPGRADWILQITNDAWFGKLTGPWQHLAQARLRAIEQGLPLLRAANTGVSAVIDARGQIVAQIPLGVADFLDAALPPALPAPLYARSGDGPIFLLLIGLAALMFTRRRRANA